VIGAGRLGAGVIARDNRLPQTARSRARIADAHGGASVKAYVSNVRYRGRARVISLPDAPAPGSPRSQLKSAASAPVHRRENKYGVVGGTDAATVGA
jgi:hypothetical protein